MPILSQVGTMIDGVKYSGSPDDAATKLKTKDNSLIILRGGEGELHAEQRLLLVVAYLLRDNVIPQTIHVWGAKPPCGSCKSVLKAFNQAFNNCFDGVILFSGVAGQNRAVNRLSLHGIFGNPPGEFGRFVNMYETELA